MCYQCNKDEMGVLCFSFIAVTIFLGVLEREGLDDKSFIKTRTLIRLLFADAVLLLKSFGWHKLVVSKHLIQIYSTEGNFVNIFWNVQ